MEAGADHLKVTAQKWLELSPDDRERTAIYSSGRAARGELNRMVQQGLKAEGAIQGKGLG
ncbi:hypothetical protein [Blastomonas fulva]|uniref:Uncharacterized protein n=1 Tax=Blastomonas fulva TaxID=1550728 RepID=A0ABM6MCZ8_9SPHN|nr:hypothetical protein [Blastomonas fulva]ASR53796.1 hypothetical protein B5J99_19420 [Blastomonas fulva]